MQKTIAHLERLGNNPQGPVLSLKLDKLPIRTLFDSGNLFETVMSEEFFNKLPREKRRLVPLEDDAKIVPTAKTGSGMMIVGRLEKPITLTFQSGGISLMLRPVVLRGLTTPLNVSYKTMEEKGIDVLASRGVIMFQGRKVWLGTKPPRNLHEPVSVHIEGVHVIPPMTRRYVPARVKNMKTF